MSQPDQSRQVSAGGFRRRYGGASPERRVSPAAGRVAGGPMSGWVSRFLAAIGVGGHKAEADVSYDPAVDDRSGDSDLDRPAEEPHR
jgi:hypothetical protein